MKEKKFESLVFPHNFWWGAAASAPQTEGESVAYGKSPNTWDKWFEMAPELFSEIGPGRTSNVYNLYKEDISRMKETHFNSYRTSISWSRLLPDGRTVNQEAVQFYRDYFQELRRAGIEPIINLFHFDMPWWMMEKGGWLNPEITVEFSYYARQCVELFGDIVQYWVTFNEPLVHIECSYINGMHYPAIKNLKKAVLAGYNTILAHAKAVQVMREVNPAIKVGVILNITPPYSRSQRADDKKATQIAALLHVESLLDPMIKGVFPSDLIDLLDEHNLMIETDIMDLEIIKSNTADFLGVNYYQPMRVQCPNKPVHKPAQSLDDFYALYNWEKRRINPYRGWEIYPEAIYDIAMMIKNKYDNIPWYLSENGIGVADEQRFEDENGIIQDDYRIEFIKEHLTVLHRSIQEGAYCFGYHLWTFVDCWSWLNGYRNRYGLYRVNLKNQVRTPKKSSAWFKSFIESQKDYAEGKEIQ